MHLSAGLTIGNLFPLGKNPESAITFEKTDISPSHDEAGPAGCDGARPLV